MRERSQQLCDYSRVAIEGRDVQAREPVHVFVLRIRARSKKRGDHRGVAFSHRDVEGRGTGLGHLEGEIRVPGNEGGHAIRVALSSRDVKRSGAILCRSVHLRRKARGA